MKRAYSPKELLSIRRRLLENLPTDWCDMLGTPEATGTWLVWGQSGNGKTSFVLQLCKMLTNYGTVLYNSLEEGTALTMARAIERADLTGCRGRFKIVDGESMADLSLRLKKRRSPDFIVIDSFQYTGMSYRDYIQLKESNPTKLFVFVSHADGKHPAGRAARSVKYDATLKVWIEGYKAFSNGRYIGRTGQYTVWQEGADEYWGSNNQETEE